MWDNLWGGLQQAGNSAYGWAKDNPLEAFSLGAGAVGTGMGIWDQYQAAQRQDQRQKLAEQLSKAGPTAFNPNWSPQQLEAMYMRPAATFTGQMQGQFDGGSFRQALADAALKAEADRNQIGNQIYQSRLGALGYGPIRGATGNTGAFGGALQNLILSNAMKRYPPPQPPPQPQQPPQMGAAIGNWGQQQPQQPGGFYPAQAYQTPPNASWTGQGNPFFGTMSDADMAAYSAALPGAGMRDSFLGSDQY